MASENNRAAAEFAAKCIESGDARSEVVEALQTLFNVSRATAYRIVARALLGVDAPSETAIVRREDGTIDLGAEASRQYADAVAREDERAILAWFGIMRKLAPD